MFLSGGRSETNGFEAGRLLGFRFIPIMPSRSHVPQDIVQRQFEAYNAHDVEGILGAYAEDAQHFEYPAKLLATGKAELRARFTARFQDPRLNVSLVHRVVAASYVLDHENVSATFAEGTGTTEMVAIYEGPRDKIARAWFILGAVKVEMAP